MQLHLTRVNHCSCWVFMYMNVLSSTNLPQHCYRLGYWSLLLVDSHVKFHDNSGCRFAGNARTSHSPLHHPSVSFGAEIEEETQEGTGGNGFSAWMGKYTIVMVRWEGEGKKLI